MTNQNVTSPALQVNPSFPASPYLVINGQVNASRKWSRKQRRSFQRLMSFCYERLGQGCQLLRVDLTSPSGGDSKTLSRKLEELKRRVKRVFGYEVKAFVVRTSEGNGVLHMIWAINHLRAVYIPYEWLKEQWEDIHGAWNVSIRRMKPSEVKRAAGYITSQYLAGQSSVEYVSWPYGGLTISLARSWHVVRSEVMKGYLGACKFANHFNRILDRGDLFNTWRTILDKGFCRVAGVCFFISSRSIEFYYE